MHRHGYQGRKLGRERGPRQALLRGLVSSLILHEELVTTEAKAREIQPQLDRLINRARSGKLSDRRRAQASLLEPLALSKLYQEVAEVYRGRSSGYTRIVKIGSRLGDGAAMVRISLVDYEPTRARKADKVAVGGSAEGGEDAPDSAKTAGVKAGPKRKVPRKREQAPA